MSSTELVTISKEEFEALRSENAWLKHQLAELKRLIYGAKSERFVTQNPDQATLFDLPAEQSQENDYFGPYHATHSGVNRASDSGANHASDFGVNRATHFGANHATFFC